MNFSGINYESFADGEGVRVSFFVSGCKRHCKGCFNQEAWNFDAGYPVTDDVYREIKKHINKPYIAGITILGGEPMEYENMECALTAVLIAKSYGKTAWVYSGYTFEELCERNDILTDSILSYTDVFVDGAYDESQRDITLPFRGSKNQRIIDVRASLDNGYTTLVKKYKLCN